MSKRFKRDDSWDHPRLKTGWRKPRGIDNKQRLQRRSRHPWPRIGYGTERGLRNRHPGAKLPEALVANGRALDALSKGLAVRLAAGLGRAKRKALAEKAKAKGFKVLNE